MTQQIPKPRPRLQLSGEDGNALFIIGRARRVLRDAGYSKEYVAQFQAEAMAGDYDHVLQTCMRYFEVD